MEFAELFEFPVVKLNNPTKRRLSMSFLNPLGWIAAITLPIIVVLYLLKLKRRQQIISSTLLWRKSIEDLTANAPFQKLRRNILLYLQLLIAALLTFALARPVMKLSDEQGMKYIVLLDISASMKTRDGEDGVSRIDQAKNITQQLIDQMRAHDRMTLIAFSDKTQILQSETRDKNLLKSRLSLADAEETGTNINDALAFADSLARPDWVQSGEAAPSDAAAYDPRTKIIIISDGNLQEANLSLAQTPNIEYAPVGSTFTANVGITEMDITNDLEKQGVPLVFASVKNYGSEKVSRLLRMQVDGKAADVKSFTLDAGQEARTRLYPLGEDITKASPEALSTTHTVELQLTDESGAALTEPFDVDDAAYGILSPQRDTKVLLVSKGNVFLERLLGLLKNAQLSLVSPDDYRRPAGFDIVIYDNFSPKELGPGNYLFLKSIPPLDGFELMPEVVKNPLIIDWNRVHLLTRYVNFTGVQVLQALEIKHPSWARVMVEAETIPMILSFDRQRVRGVVCAFDPGESDWPLRPSFPIFFMNTMRWLSQSQELKEQPVLKTGTVIPLTPSAAEDRFTIRQPDGRTDTIEIEDGQTAYYADTKHAGFYEISSENGEQIKLALNLTSHVESDIAPKPELQFGRETVQRNFNAGRLAANREVWMWFLWAALGVLALEWLIYCRRTWT